MKIHIIYISIIVFISLTFGILWFKDKSIDLEYYQEQNLLVNKNFGFEMETYNLTKNPVEYKFYNNLCKVTFKKFP